MKFKIQRAPAGEHELQAHREAYYLERARKLIEESGFVSDPSHPGRYIPEPDDADRRKREED